MHSEETLYPAHEAKKQILDINQHDFNAQENTKKLDRIEICLNKGKIVNEQLSPNLSVLKTLLERWIDHLNVLQSEEIESSDKESSDIESSDIESRYHLIYFIPIADKVEHDYSNPITTLGLLLEKLQKVTEILTRTLSPKPDSEGKAAQDRLTYLVDVWDEMKTTLSSTDLFKNLTVQILLFNTALDPNSFTSGIHEIFLGRHSNHPEVIKTISELVQSVIKTPQYTVLSDFLN
ncbi:MAG: hypothetical protein EXS67_03845 [Candidatus Margulisbacteria bacterium]|nr:hypothetical protein [Candidatus Margulisiibacteriota bacterium]